LKKLFSNQRVCAGADHGRSIPLCYNIGRAAVGYLSLKNAPFIIVAKDCQSSTEILQLSVADAVCALGGEVLLLDNMTASAAAVLLKKYRADFMLFLYASAGESEGGGESICGNADGNDGNNIDNIGADNVDTYSGANTDNRGANNTGIYGADDNTNADGGANTDARKGASYSFAAPIIAAPVAASVKSPAVPATAQPDVFVEFFDHTGYNISPRAQKKIEQLIAAASFCADISTDKYEGETPLREGEIYSRPDAYVDYCDFVLSNIPIKNMAQKIVVDCGFDCRLTAPYIFKRLVSDATFYNDFFDGRLLDDAPRTRLLSKKVLRNKADIGIGFSGTGGGFSIIDEKGAVVDNGVVFYLFLKELAAKQKLKQNAAAVPPELNLSVVKALDEINVRVHKTDGSRKSTVREMVENDIDYGYDSLGRIYFGELFTGCDCIFCAANLCRLLYESGKTLSALCSQITLKPAKSLHIFADEGRLNRLTEDEILKQTINLYNYKLNGEGGVALLRHGSKAVEIAAQGEKCGETLAKLKALVTQRLNKNI
jgi:phosphoglucosamine mutase